MIKLLKILILCTCACVAFMVEIPMLLIPSLLLWDSRYIAREWAADMYFDELCKEFERSKRTD